MENKVEFLLMGFHFNYIYHYNKYERMIYYLIDY